jgi:hypothetical protein
LLSQAISEFAGGYLEPVKRSNQFSIRANRDGCPCFVQGPTEPFTVLVLWSVVRLPFRRAARLDHGVYIGLANPDPPTDAKRWQLLVINPVSDGLRVQLE